MQSLKFLENKASPELPQLALILQDSNCKEKLLIEKVAKSMNEAQIIQGKTRKKWQLSLIFILK